VANLSSLWTTTVGRSTEDMVGHVSATRRTWTATFTSPICQRIGIKSAKCWVVWTQLLLCGVVIRNVQVCIDEFILTAALLPYSSVVGYAPQNEYWAWGTDPNLDPSPDTALPRHGHTLTRPYTDTALPRHGHASTRPCPNTAMPRHGHAPTRPCTNTAMHQHGHALTHPRHGHAPTLPCPNTAMPQHGHAPTRPCPDKAMHRHGRASRHPCTNTAMHHHGHAPTHANMHHAPRHPCTHASCPGPRPKPSTEPSPGPRISLHHSATVWSSRDGFKKSHQSKSSTQLSLGASDQLPEIRSAGLSSLA